MANGDVPRDMTVPASTVVLVAAADGVRAKRAFHDGRDRDVEASPPGCVPGTTATMPGARCVPDCDFAPDVVRERWPRMIMATRQQKSTLQVTDSVTTIAVAGENDRGGATGGANGCGPTGGVFGGAGGTPGGAAGGVFLPDSMSTTSVGI